MLKLLKYELRKTRNVKWALVVLTTVLEVLFLIGLYSYHGGMLGSSIVLLAFMSMISLVVVGLQSVVTLHRDFNSHQAYMLFMTPHSCWKVLGAKVLECALSVLMVGALYVALGSLDVTLLLQQQGTLKEAMEQVKLILSAFFEGNYEVAEFAITMLFAVCYWLYTVLSAFFADVTISAVFNGKRFTGLLWIVLFIALGIGNGLLLNMLPSLPVKMLLLAMSGVCLTCAAVLYMISAWIMEHWLSV